MEFADEDDDDAPTEAAEAAPEPPAECAKRWSAEEDTAEVEADVSEEAASEADAGKEAWPVVKVGYRDESAAAAVPLRSLSCPPLSSWASNRSVGFFSPNIGPLTIFVLRSSSFCACR